MRSLRFRDGTILATTLAATLALAGCGPDGEGGASGGAPASATAFNPLPTQGRVVSDATDHVVSHVKVVSDKVEDVSSLDAWRRSFIRDDMGDEEKALAVWMSVVKFRHQDEPPREYLQAPYHVHDPIRAFNVYGYSQCCCASSFIEALGRHAGLEVRGRSIKDHSVPEVAWGGAWHLLDGAFITYFRRDDGAIASVDDLVAAVGGFTTANPAARGNFDLLRQMRSDGRWRSGPPLLAHCPFYDAGGLFAAGIQGWDTTMFDYDFGVAPDVTEFDNSQGYEVNVQLARGLRLVRNWSNRGLHVNQAEGLACDSLNATVGAGEFAYSPRFGDLAPGRVGNGTFEWQVPLDEGLLATALTADNLRAVRGGGIEVRDAQAPGKLVVRMPSSYVYLGGTLSLSAATEGDATIDILVSDNHGLDWRPVAQIVAPGEQSFDLSPLLVRRYDFELAAVLHGVGARLERMSIRCDVQHSQRALPALAAGDNEIRFSADDAPGQGTITIEGSTDPATSGKNLVFSDFHAVVEDLVAPPLAPAGAGGRITFPVQTPGPMTRLRVGTSYRARDEVDRWDYLVSFDEGATWTRFATAAGPTAGAAKYAIFDGVPANTRRALIRFDGAQRTALAIFDFRIDADYLEPHGGFDPVRITYSWTESGREREDIHVARSPSERYSIHCDGPPRMNSIAVELEAP